MERLRQYLRGWLVPEIKDHETAIEAHKIVLTKLNTDYTEIEKHLSGISEFADYVRDKDEKASEIFATMEKIDLLPDMTLAEVNQELSSASTVKAALLSEPAIGSTEIKDKNNKIAQVNAFIIDLEKKRGELNGRNN